MKENTTERMGKAPIGRLIISMSLPMALSMLVNSLYNIIDSFFVAKICEDAMTALSLVFPLQNIVNSVAVGFSIGMNATVAFHLGAREPDKADDAASLSLILSAVHGILLTIILLLAIPHFLRMYTSDKEVLKMGLQYSHIVFLYAIVNTVMVFYEKLFQSVGRMKTTMIGMSVGCITNIILDPVMIFGIGPFPAMGVKGAAIATAFGMTTTLVIYLFAYYRSDLPVRISFKAMHWDGRLIRKLYMIGIPATLNMALPSILISALNGILAAFSGVYVFVLGVYYKLQNFLYLTVNGIVQGIRPLISFNYGAGDFKRVHKIYRVSVLFSVAIMAFGMALCLLVPDAIFHLFTQNKETIEIGAAALKIVSFGFVVSSISVITCGALEALGMGPESLVISVLRYAALIIPIAWILSHYLGADGVWYSFWISEVLTALVAWTIYKKRI